MAISHQVSSGISTTTGNNGSTSVATAYPAGVAAGRIALLFVTVKLNTATFGSDPAGWTKLGEVAGGTGTSANDAGSTKLGCWYKVLDGSESGSVTVTNTGGVSSQGCMSIYTNGTGNWITPIMVSGSDGAHGTNWSATCGAWSSALAANDWVVAGCSSDTDTNQTITAPTITQTSATFGARTQRNQQLCSTGTDSGVHSWDCSVTTGNTNAPTWTHTSATSTCGGTIAVRLREDSTQAVTPAATTVSVTPGTLTVTPPPQSVTPQATTVTVTPGSLVVTPPPQAVTPAAVTVSATPGSLEVTQEGAGELAITPQAVTVSVTPGSLSTAMSLGPTGPAVTITTGTLSVAQSLALTGGTVSITPGSLTVAPGPVSITPSQTTVGVTPGTLSIAVEGGTQNVTPAAVTVGVTPGSVSISRTITPAAVTVSASPGSLTVTRGPVTVTPAAVIVSIGAGVLVVSQPGDSENEITTVVTGPARHSARSGSGRYSAAISAERHAAAAEDSGYSARPGLGQHGATTGDR